MGVFVRIGDDSFLTTSFCSTVRYVRTRSWLCSDPSNPFASDESIISLVIIGFGNL